MVLKIPSCCSRILAPGVSDHALAFITFGVPSSTGFTPFKFFSFWAEHKDFLKWVEEAWNQDVQGVPMYKLYCKLKSVKGKLKNVNKKVFGALLKRSQKIN